MLNKTESTTKTIWQHR